MLSFQIHHKGERFVSRIVELMITSIKLKKQFQWHIGKKLRQKKFKVCFGGHVMW
jgi:hypothetical protein